MQQQDRQRQQGGSGSPRGAAAASDGEVKRRGDRQHREEDRGDDQEGREAQGARKQDGAHAQIVHGRDTRADHRRANDIADPVVPEDARPQPGPGHNDGDGQRRHRAPRQVADHDAGIVAEHRDEVGRPDPRARRKGRADQPAGPLACRRGAEMAQQEHDAAGRRDADQGRERYQPLVMLMGQTEEDVEHLLRPFTPRELDRVP